MFKMSASVRVDNPTIINNYLSSFSYSTELGKWGGGGGKDTSRWEDWIDFEGGQRRDLCLYWKYLCFRYADAPSKEFFQTSINFWNCPPS